MAILTLAELDAARDKARAVVHRRALKAAGRAAVPFIFGADALATLVADVQAIFELSAEERAALAPTIATGLADLVGAYAPAALGAEAVAGMTARLAGHPVARIAGRTFGGRFVRRVAAGRGLLGTVARRAWVIPAALGGGAAARYELVGRRCINQCYAFVRANLAPAPRPA